ncbi:MAG TPA: hypothetical protein PLV25_04985, partial [Opitutales bacterium]|nr:hypothetical protein [Opitutales bacterium]
TRWWRLPKFRKKPPLNVLLLLVVLITIAPAVLKAQPRSARNALQPSANLAPIESEPQGTLPPELAYLRSEAAKHPEDLRYAYNFGTRAYELGDYALATPPLEAATASTDIPLQQKAFYNLGNTLYREGQQLRPENPNKTLEIWKGSLTNFKSACELDPSDANAHYNKQFVENKIKELEDELKKQNPPPPSPNKDKQEPNKDQQDKNDQAKHGSEGGG